MRDVPIQVPLPDGVGGGAVGYEESVDERASRRVRIDVRGRYVGKESTVECLSPSVLCDLPDAKGEL
jgi:hypothetical protein